jgi:hypothetical protein
MRGGASKTHDALVANWKTERDSYIHYAQSSLDF